MIRTQLYLSAEELAALDRVAAETGRTRSVLVRDAIESTYMRSPHRDAVAEALRAAYGAWKRRRPADDGARYVDRLRRGRLAKKLRRARPAKQPRGARA